jgi:hypothetical protein
MNLKARYQAMMKHESGEDCFIPDEPKPIGDSHQFIYHWFGKDIRNQQPVVMTDEMKAAIEDCLTSSPRQPS